MYVKNFLNPGDFILPVPLGLDVTLQYDENGKLSKIFCGFMEYEDDITDDLKLAVWNSCTIPLEVKITGGTTWVTGVFYTTKQYNVEGPLPDAIRSSVLKEISNHPESFTFHALTVKSTATKFYGSGPIQQWLRVNGFSIVNGIYIPAKLTRECFIQTVNTPKFLFKFPLITHYVVFKGFRGSDIAFYSTGIHQIVCKDVVSSDIDTLSPSGQLLGSITSKSTSIQQDYGIIAKYGIKKNSIVVLDKGNMIIAAYSSDGSELPSYSDKVVCPVCGKRIALKRSEYTQCDDPDCMSKQFGIFNKFLTHHHKDPIDFSTYKEILKARPKNISDALYAEEFQDMQIETSLADLIYSVVDSNVGKSVVTAFVNSCNNNLDTIVYYIHHPSEIHTDLTLPSGESKLIKWLMSSYHAKLLLDLLQNNYIHILYSNKTFDGPAIFRDKTIYVTGSFKHGDTNTIQSILRSYGADVITEFGKDVDCVIVGDIPEGVNGQVVRKAQRSRIPVYTESKFFSRYEIDQDLRRNLVS